MFLQISISNPEMVHCIIYPSITRCISDHSLDHVAITASSSSVKSCQRKEAKIYHTQAGLSDSLLLNAYKLSYKVIPATYNKVEQRLTHFLLLCNFDFGKLTKNTHKRFIQISKEIFRKSQFCITKQLKCAEFLSLNSATEL